MYYVLHFPYINKMTQLQRVVPIVVVLGCFGLSRQEDRIIFRSGDDVESVAESLTDTGCTTPNSGRGQCVSILKCQPLLALINKPDQHDLLRLSRCGWDRDVPLVCCSDEPTIKPKRICTASDLHWCVPNTFDECCIPELSYNNIEVTTTVKSQPVRNDPCNIRSIPPKPSTECCGLSSSNLEILHDEVTKIEQYPWTAVIEYAGMNSIQIMCGGTLISGRYVLTAAHCLFIDDWTPVNIRLGDYDLDHPGVDCATDGSIDTDCTDGALIVPIEESTPHPDYCDESRAHTNDIALIKLRDNAPYTDFIRPICLPSATDFMETADNYTRLRVAGWGILRDTRSHNQLKQQLELSYVNAEDCFISYRPIRIILDEGQICAGGKGKNTCKGDSGGALMLMEDQMTEIVGISSFSSCGRTKRPAVYTKVHHYLSWIRSVIN